MTAIHSASASLLAKRQGKEDTVRLLRSQVRGLLQKIDMDGKMKKMAELQLTVVSNPKNRRAIENQVRDEAARLSRRISRGLMCERGWRSPSHFHSIKLKQCESADSKSVATCCSSDASCGVTSDPFMLSYDLPPPPVMCVGTT